jgi:5-methylthioadenosine/S-adenosylhomocysteine deaminase
MLFENITILDEELNVRHNMYVGVKDEFIEYIGSERPDDDYGESYDGKGRLLMSAFYNSHAHSPMMMMRGYGENLALSDWLNTKIFPFEDKLYSDAVYYSTLLAMAESIRFGIVSSSDMYYFCEDMARAVIESGAKANISRSITSFEEGSIKNGERYQEAVRLVKNFHGTDDGKILVDASVHAEYTNTETSIREVAQFAKEYGINMHVHISETKSEHEECKERHGGRTPVKLMNDLGVFDTNTTAAHCVWVEDEDMDILADKGVTVASCPVSNLKLASGICNVPKLLKKGINVAIGTDSVASNNSLNFIEEMKFFALLNKAAYSDPTLITPEQTIHAATYAGALAQGRHDCGRLREGNRADLIVLNIELPHMRPVHDLKTNIVYSASGSDVILTMVDGKVLYKDGDFLTIDIEKTIAETEAACRNILSQL